MATQIGRFCSYPQGIASVIPQLLALMALFSSLAAFPIFGYSTYFGCFEYTISSGTQGSSSSSTSVPTGNECYGLYLNSEPYWNVAADESNGWAAALQTAAVFGIFAAIAGFLSLGILFAATCFELPPRRILGAGVALVTSAILSLLTLVGGATDICKRIYPPTPTTTTTCSNQGFRVETGAAFEIFAALLYIAATATTFLFRRAVVQESATHPKEELMALNASQQANTVAPLGSSIPAQAPVSRAQASMGRPNEHSQVGHAQVGRNRTTTTRILPDGRVEKEYVDESGNVVREVVSGLASGYVEVTPGSEVDV
eukprot:CAMPEP_0197468146 /NCGR_PEP_ID=MMETSP1175-20131217/65931_1 /TAXON_ID=1003142 /ORGANISM="Triceratium dubium, Strain CCMP147" /LENGTH=313 /DNA_ID=CAMNT_0043004241 /DNA_START=115 /DNA_END=1056 /DNA_ORIENTATION=-